MSEGLFENVYNPDVLSCLANLSSDEVFTPPSIANAMLDMLPQEIFSNPDTRILDPACKSGVFLREAAKRFDKGLEKQIPDREQRFDHIFKKQLFGIAITELTSLISRRSVYCSAYPNSKYSVARFDDAHADGNIRFKRIEHLWKDGKCSWCGAAQAQYDRSEDNETHAYEFIHCDPKELYGMKFDVIISNPPYQLSDGGAQASAMPIYNYFVEQSKKLNPKSLIMIIPARWYSGGKNLNEFRSSMLTDRRIKELHDFSNATDCFPGVDVKGGVCYFLWQQDYNGDCVVVTHDKDHIVSTLKRPLLEENCDVFIRQNEAVDILNKIRSYNEKSFADVVFPAMTFGFRTFFKSFDSDKSGKGLVKMYANHSQGFIYRDKIERGREYIDKWKVYIPEAIGSGDTRNDIIKPILGEPGSISTETYIMNGPWESKEEAENVISYVNTKFFHFMIGLKKITQHATIKVYEFVPMQDFSKPWTDKELYQKYGLTDKEIMYIESTVWSERTIGGDDNG